MSDVSQSSLREVAVHAVDQVVVDGLVDGAERRVRFGVLLRIGAGGAPLDDSGFLEFRGGLYGDERYIDRRRDMYSYEPVIRPESTAQASLIAIVGGTALCNELERKKAMSFMDYLARVVYEQNTISSGVLSLREVSGSLKSGGFGDLNYQEFGAFLHYMYQDPRFYPIGDGRIVLTEAISGGGDMLTELPMIDDVAGAIEQALPYLFTDPSGVFTQGVLLGTLKSLGSYVRMDQMHEVFEQLRASLQVIALEDGRFKRIQSSEDGTAETAQHQLSPEAMIRAIRGGVAHKPHSRKKGGSRKRTVNM